MKIKDQIFIFKEIFYIIEKLETYELGSLLKNKDEKIGAICIFYKLLLTNK
jgi:hypothetical protein